MPHIFRSSSLTILVAVMTLFWLSGAFAQIPSAPAAPPSMITQSSSKMLSMAGQVCPERGGVFDSVSVPVDQPLDLVVVLDGGAPSGGATFQLGSDDPKIVAVGDPRQAFLRQVTIPEGQRFSNVFTVYGIRVGSTILRATSLTQGVSGFAVPLGAWDVGLGGSGKFLDANSTNKALVPLTGKIQSLHCRKSDNSAELSSDENALATCGSAVNGVVTDGVSRLLMRTVSGLPGTACFEITSVSPTDQGAIETAVKDTTLVSTAYQASSFYRAPNSFEATENRRTVEAEFVFTPSIGNGNTTRFRAKTNLVRPPVVLIHGLWSDGGTWRTSFVRNDEIFTTEVGDYGNVASASFTENVPSVEAFITRALLNSRLKGFATTQVDVVAHSMGGVLTRLHEQRPDYRRAENFGEGDIRRLVTLTTPHFGSNFANLLVALHAINGEETRRTVEDIIPSDNPSIILGAVCDLSENSPALQHLSSGTAIQAHVVSATGAPAGSTSEPAEYYGGLLGNVNFEGALTESNCVQRNTVGRCVRRQFRFPQEIVDGHRFRENNDAIVPLSSQGGGISGTAARNFRDLLHFGGSKFVFKIKGITNTEEVATYALGRLDETATSDFWRVTFPGVLSDGAGIPRTVPGVPEKNADWYSEQCASGGPMKPAVQEIRALSSVARTAATLEDDWRVRIVSPVEGQVYAPTDILLVTVQIEPPLVAVDIQVRVLGLGRFEGSNFDGSNYEVSFVVPEGYAGPITLIPAIVDETGTTIEGRSVRIAVRSAESPGRISLLQRTHFMNLLDGRSGQLHVIGVYSEEDERNVSASAAGTTYISSNQAVVQVDADGQMVPIGTGTAVITVENLGIKDFAMVEVRQGDEPLLPESVNDKFQIQLAGLRLDRRSGFFVQQVRLTNISGKPILGPLHMVIDGLPNDVELVNRDGMTQNVAPIGSPYFRLQPLVFAGLGVEPGQSFELTFGFLNPNRRRISYDLNVVRADYQP